MAKAHKATNQEQSLLRRKLAVEGLDDRQWDNFIHELNEHPCVDFAKRRLNNQLSVTFDGIHWTTDELLGLIETHGGRLKTGWWVRQKLAWYRSTEANVQANAKHEPFCCSKMPPMKK